MTLAEMLPLPLAAVDLGSVGERVVAVGGLVITALAGLWLAWARPAVQPVPVPVRANSRRTPPRRR
ncbi:hypothetical protein KRR26_16625 [Corallococcus sp. M34]|uniref:hypothetical protein n=1 Tax=Citreicoccus inhibens TaxID=2849499 RepID=UPI001C221A5A|nr:hypothetical protein [Citreicoccus inhibens]MBU8897242.1 hypothetical protein [Citreicoccus inhibens]